MAIQTFLLLLWWTVCTGPCVCSNNRIAGCGREDTSNPSCSKYPLRLASLRVVCVLNFMLSVLIFIVRHVLYECKAFIKLERAAVRNKITSCKGKTNIWQVIVILLDPVLIALARMTRRSIVQDTPCLLPTWLFRLQKWNDYIYNERRKSIRNV